MVQIENLCGAYCIFAGGVRVYWVEALVGYAHIEGYCMCAGGEGVQALTRWGGALAIILIMEISWTENNVTAICHVLRLYWCAQ